MSSFPFGPGLEDTDLILGMYPVILGAITTQRETRAHKPNLTLVAIRSTFPACLTRLTNWISIYWLTACAIWAACDTAKIDMRYTKNMIIGLLRQMGTHAGPEGRTHYSKKRLFFFVSVRIKNYTRAGFEFFMFSFSTNTRGTAQARIYGAKTGSCCSGVILLFPKLYKKDNSVLVILSAGSQI